MVKINVNITDRTSVCIISFHIITLFVVKSDFLGFSGILGGDSWISTGQKIQIQFLSSS